MQYTNRLDFRQENITYELTEAGIDSNVGLLPFKDITEIHLSYEPTKNYGNIFKCAITAKNRSLTLSNRRYISIGNFEYHSEQYSAFITTLHAQLSYQSAQFTRGKSKSRYWLEIPIVIISFTILTMLISSFGTIYMGLSFLAISLYKLIPYYKLNYPGTYDPKQIPTNLLPTS